VIEKKGIITPMEIKAVIMNHNDEQLDKVNKKSGDGKSAFDLEKAYA
jgi:hypothetical protein